MWCGMCVRVWCGMCVSGWQTVCVCAVLLLIYHLVPKGVHENRTQGVVNKVDDTLKLVVFLECAQC